MRASVSLGEVLVPLASPGGLVCPESNNFPYHPKARLYKKDTKWYLTILETLMGHMREEGFSCWGVVVHRHRRDVLVPEKKIHAQRKLPLGNGSFGGNGRVFSTIEKVCINRDPIFLAAVSWTIAEVHRHWAWCTDDHYMCMESNKSRAHRDLPGCPGQVHW